MPNSSPVRILFVCTGNAGRSQMAEALARVRWGSDVEVMSAGVAPWPHLHPMAVMLMDERGVRFDTHYPKHVSTWATTKLDVVITIGQVAQAHTPQMMGAPVLFYWDIDDPADSDETPNSEAHFRQTLAAIEEHLVQLDSFLAEQCNRTPTEDDLLR